ncbi:hypothetical protein Nepgr_010302 [Nepenthes gracilis]|uniref:DUF4005 domain-containing protein n=1 Tax=Nepenthes gracilis TaxID=150966 RepID=A0AAD3SD56_NEPGR|nr:hypothetical protein Nepgr_010302 [Nepenthes gracilis]
MGKTGKWIRNFLTGKKEKEKETSNQLPTATAGNPTTPMVILPSAPKEKRRWSFRRSSAAAGPKDSNSADASTATPAAPACVDSDRAHRKHALAVAAAPVAAEVAAAAAIRHAATADSKSSAIEEAAALKIQCVFRSYLARKALRALRGLVKLQALVRGHLVRKQARTTLRCMQALVTAQARARAQRVMAIEEATVVNQRQSTHRKTTPNKCRRSYQDVDRVMEENIKVVEMDLAESKSSLKSRNSHSNHQQSERLEHRSSSYPSQCECSKQDYPKISSAASAMTDISPRTCSGHFEDYSFTTAQSSPYFCSDVLKNDPGRIPLVFPRPEYAESISYDHPNYMANTESSRAKLRSQSAPKQRPDSFERQLSRRRPSVEGRNVPRAVRMQRSSSHVGSTGQNYQNPWSLKLDRSTVSLRESECGSTCSVATNSNYCRSLVSYDLH